jgi:hypothetical protein
MNILKTAKKVTLLTLLTLFLADNIVAQLTRTGRTRDDRRSQAEDIPVNEKLAYAFNIGNIGFSGGGFGGSGFTVSAKAMAGYKFAKPLTAGVHLKAFYDIFGVPNAPDISLFSYGTGIFGRVTILEQFFLQGEYNLTSYDGDSRTFPPNRDTYTYPMVGGGYESGFGPWKYGIMLLFNLKEEVRDIGGVGFGEYWITFSYNF